MTVVERISLITLDNRLNSPSYVHDNSFTDDTTNLTERVRQLEARMSMVERRRSPSRGSWARNEQGKHLPRKLENTIEFYGPGADINPGSMLAVRHVVMSLTERLDEQLNRLDMRTKVPNGIDFQDKPGSATLLYADFERPRPFLAVLTCTNSASLFGGQTSGENGATSRLNNEVRILKATTSALELEVNTLSRKIDEQYNRLTMNMDALASRLRGETDSKLAGLSQKLLKCSNQCSPGLSLDPANPNDNVDPKWTKLIEDRYKHIPSVWEKAGYRLQMITACQEISMRRIYGLTEIRWTYITNRDGTHRIMLDGLQARIDEQLKVLHVRLQQVGDAQSELRAKLDMEQFGFRKLCSEVAQDVSSKLIQPDDRKQPKPWQTNQLPQWSNLFRCSIEVTALKGEYCKRRWQTKVESEVIENPSADDDLVTNHTLILQKLNSIRYKISAEISLLKCQWHDDVQRLSSQCRDIEDKISSVGKRANDDKLELEGVLSAEIKTRRTHEANMHNHIKRIEERLDGVSGSLRNSLNELQISLCATRPTRSGIKRNDSSEKTDSRATAIKDIYRRLEELNEVHKRQYNNLHKEPDLGIDHDSNVVRFGTQRLFSNGEPHSRKRQFALLHNEMVNVQTRISQQMNVETSSEEQASEIREVAESLLAVKLALAMKIKSLELKDEFATLSKFNAQCAQDANQVNRTHAYYGAGISVIPDEFHSDMFPSNVRTLDTIVDLGGLLIEESFLIVCNRFWKNDASSSLEVELLSKMFQCEQCTMNALMGAPICESNRIKVSQMNCFVKTSGQDKDPVAIAAFWHSRKTSSMCKWWVWWNPTTITRKSLFESRKGVYGCSEEEYDDGCEYTIEDIFDNPFRELHRTPAKPVLVQPYIMVNAISHRVLVDPLLLPEHDKQLTHRRKLRVLQEGTHYRTSTIHAIRHQKEVTSNTFVEKLGVVFFHSSFEKVLNEYMKDSYVSFVHSSSSRSANAVLRYNWVHYKCSSRLPVNRRLAVEELGTCRALLKYGTPSCKMQPFVADEFGNILTTQAIHNNCWECWPALLKSFRFQAVETILHKFFKLFPYSPNGGCRIKIYQKRCTPYTRSQTTIDVFNGLRKQLNQVMHYLRGLEPRRATPIIKQLAVWGKRKGVLVNLSAKKTSCDGDSDRRTGPYHGVCVSVLSGSRRSYSTADVSSAMNTWHEGRYTLLGRAYVLTKTTNKIQLFSSSNLDLFFRRNWWAPSGQLIRHRGPLAPHNSRHVWGNPTEDVNFCEKREIPRVEQSRRGVIDNFGSGVEGRLLSALKWLTKSSNASYGDGYASTRWVATLTVISYKMSRGDRLFEIGRNGQVTASKVNFQIVCFTERTNDRATYALTQTKPTECFSAGVKIRQRTRPSLLLRQTLTGPGELRLQTARAPRLANKPAKLRRNGYANVLYYKNESSYTEYNITNLNGFRQTLDCSAMPNNAIFTTLRSSVVSTPVYLNHASLSTAFNHYGSPQAYRKTMSVTIYTIARVHREKSYSLLNPRSPVEQHLYPCRLLCTRTKQTNKRPTDYFNGRAVYSVYYVVDLLISNKTPLHYNMSLRNKQEEGRTVTCKLQAYFRPKSFREIHREESGLYLKESDKQLGGKLRPIFLVNSGLAVRERVSAILNQETKNGVPWTRHPSKQQRTERPPKSRHLNPN
ncbi:hypothetical protein CLF_104265 [Clonorchis sinensis]|uniref:Uncharacterized protein n=1 Tax=Clonorchis sinensis TaxID=79923 RepID=G7YB98_CLOSI|nr:hypothetical protein CLF_104265 [Clonorchis sinensis]